MGNVLRHGFNQHKHNGNVMCWDGSGGMGSVFLFDGISRPAVQFHRWLGV
jgi:hypothetical protein